MSCNIIFFAASFLVIRLENGIIKRRRLFFPIAAGVLYNAYPFRGSEWQCRSLIHINLVHNASFRVIYIYEWIRHIHGYVDRWGWEMGKTLSLACKCKTSTANRCLSKELASKSACHFGDAKGCHLFRFNMVRGGFIYQTQTVNVWHIYLHAWLICMVTVDDDTIH